MSTLADEFNALRAAKYAEQEVQRASLEAGRDDEMSARPRQREDLLTYMRRAEKWEYDAWLTGYMKQGGAPTHFYEYVMPVANWFVPLIDFMVTPLYGSLSINIVVPQAIRFQGGATGHNTLFVATAEGEFLGQEFHDSRPHPQPRWVPVYEDTEVLA